MCKDCSCPSKGKNTDTDKVNQVLKILELAENWTKKQVMPESHICVSALKDIRVVVIS